MSRCYVQETASPRRLGIHIVFSLIHKISPSPKIKNFKEAVQALEDVQTFLESRGCLDSAHTTSLLLSDVASNYVSSNRALWITSCRSDNLV